MEFLTDQTFDKLKFNSTNVPVETVVLLKASNKGCECYIAWDAVFLWAALTERLCCIFYERRHSRLAISLEWADRAERGRLSPVQNAKQIRFDTSQQYSNGCALDRLFVICYCWCFPICRNAERFAPTGRCWYDVTLHQLSGKIFFFLNT